MSNYNPFSLEGKTILVTGASSGIGQATAIECSKMGAKLVITGRNQERLQETFNQLAGDGHQQILADLTNQKEIDKIVEFIPLVNGVVLCAGTIVTVPMSFATKEKFSNVFEVNFFAPMELLRLGIKKKKVIKSASVVFVSSIGGNWGFSLGNGVYGTSKAAINSAMKFWAKELSPKKIRVNSVNPGMVNTKLIQGGTVSEEQHKIDMERYPLKRYGEPIEIAHGIIYLLSDASSWVTGHSLVIDGGVTI